MNAQHNNQQQAPEDGGAVNQGQDHAYAAQYAAYGAQQPVYNNAPYPVYPTPQRPMPAHHPMRMGYPGTAAPYPQFKGQANGGFMMNPAAAFVNHQPPIVNQQHPVSDEQPPVAAFNAALRVKAEVVEEVQYLGIFKRDARERRVDKEIKELQKEFRVLKKEKIARELKKNIDELIAEAVSAQSRASSVGLPIPLPAVVTGPVAAVAASPRVAVATVRKPRKSKDTKMERKQRENVLLELEKAREEEKKKTARAQRMRRAEKRRGVEVARVEQIEEHMVEQMEEQAPEEVMKEISEQSTDD